MRVAGRQASLRSSSSAAAPRSMHLGGSAPGTGNAETVMVRNWLRRWSFSVSVPYAMRETCRSGALLLPLARCDVEVLDVGEAGRAPRCAAARRRDLLVALAQRRQRQRRSSRPPTRARRRGSRRRRGWRAPGRPCSLTVKLSSPQSSRTPRRRSASRGRSPWPPPPAGAARRCPRPRCARRPGCRPACRSRARARRRARRGSSAESAAAARRNRCVGVVLVAYLDEDLRVVELLQLRRDREPEARAAAADERGHRLAAPRAACRPSPGVRLPVLVGDLRGRSRSACAVRALVADSGASSGSQTSTYDRYDRSFGKNCVFDAASRSRRRRRGPARDAERRASGDRSPSRTTSVVRAGEARAAPLARSALRARRRAAGSSRAAA